MFQTWAAESQTYNLKFIWAKYQHTWKAKFFLPWRTLKAIPKNKISIQYKVKQGAVVAWCHKNLVMNQLIPQYNLIIYKVQNKVSCLPSKLTVSTMVKLLEICLKMIQSKSTLIKWLVEKVLEQCRKIKEVTKAKTLKRVTNQYKLTLTKRQANKFLKQCRHNNKIMKIKTLKRTTNQYKLT